MAAGSGFDIDCAPRVIKRRRADGDVVLWRPRHKIGKMPVLAGMAVMDDWPPRRLNDAEFALTIHDTL